jgi:Fur family ferric uptake transcriptional regulator
LKTIDLNARVQYWLDELKSSGYRLTSARHSVVEILAASQFTLNPTQIFVEARQLSPELGLVTVYRTLEKLEDLGLIQRVHRVNGCHSYIAAPAGHQHLLICDNCNRAEYFSGDNLSELIEQLDDERGYRIEGHWLQLHGICPDCRQKTSKESA